MKNWHSVLISPNDSIRNVLARIDSAAINIGLVVDSERKLVGTVTDGDIRRALLSGLGLDDTVDKCMFREPTTANVTDSRSSILAKMRKLVLHQIPVIDDQGTVVHLAMLDDYLAYTARENWVIIMAGGPGSRLKELTRTVPKPMLRVGRKPILETIISRMVDQGFKNLWIAVNYRASQIETYFEDGRNFGANIKYLREKTRMGTAGALSLLPDLPSDPVLVSNADLLANISYTELLGAHLDSSAAATMAVREYEYQIPFGVVRTEKEAIIELDEKPVHTALVNAGVYVLSPEILQHVPRDTFYDMTQLFDALIELGIKTRSHKIDGYWLDIGRYDDFCRANNDFDEVFGD